MSSWRTDSFIVTQCPSLSVVTLLALQSAVSEIHIATPAFFRLVLAWYIFLYPFPFNLYTSLYLKWVSCRQCIVGSCFLIHPDNLCLFFFFFWLCWVFVAARGLSLVAVNRGYSLLPCVGFSLRWLLLLQSTGSRHVGFSSCGTQAQ